MKNVFKLGFFCLLFVSLFVAASPPAKNQLNKYEIKQECYCPFAVGCVRLENGIGTIEHPKLDWDSIPIFSLYISDSIPGSTITVCWAVSSKMQICSSDPNDNSIYSFVIYDGKASGIIFPSLK